MKNDEEIVYQLTVADIREPAEEYLERRLTKKELSLIGNSVGDYLDTFQAVVLAIGEHIDAK